MYRLFSAGCKYSPHPYSLPLALVLALTLAVIPTRAQAQQGKRVWTTEDVNELGARGLISIVGQELEPTPAAAPAAAPVQAAVPRQGPIYNSRTEDPAWYADQAAQLQAQLDASATALAQAQNNLAQAKNLSGMTGSVDLGQENLGVTPEEVIANLEEQARDVQGRLDELADLARRNDIAPGVLREAS